VRDRMLRHGMMIVMAVALLAAACGDDGDGDDEPASSDASAPLLSASDAPAATGSGLAQPPGPAERRPPDGVVEFDEVAIAIVDENGDVTGWCVLLAETGRQRQRGLMEVTDLGGYAGMLFVMESERELSFYMRNTPMPLSIAWFDNNGRFVSATDMEPCADRLGCPTYRSGAPARFALEVAQGELEALGIGDGSQLRAGGSCAG
jgi:uncharacterized protein